ncbi:hypothetical protein ACFOQM_12655 [Paenibacillus sp. GCM10012307]|uniref:Uncharacterized protein n=1 Tax=Paenibacillus roseus TaxID=2798579 RepID=A0A934J8B7_9BACL|nr:hypothetical protein [Paenibacillus roseus]MBJ6362143.1 hypothetical protein [Paenibacillus roseus]
MIQKIRDITEVSLSSSSMLDLSYIFTPGTKNDTVNEGKQMTKLRFREFQLQG